MSTPAVAEGRAVGSDAGDNYINLSNNVRLVPAGGTIARSSAMSTSTSRRGRTNASREQQGTDETDDNFTVNPQNAVSSTSGANENIPDGGNAALAPVEDFNLQRTLTPLMRIKLSELSTSSSDSEGDEMQQQDLGEDGAAGNNDARRAVSPPPNCAICLGRCKNKCFTDSCMHQFCFKCLCEWSKVKPECPLCKQIFKSIIHNVKSIDQFEEYHVQPPTVQIPHRPMEVTIRSLPYIFDAVVVEGHDWELPRRRNSVHRLRPPSNGIFYPSDVSNNGEHGLGSNGARMYNHLVYQNELLDMYRQEAPDAIASSGTLSQLWRRFVYDRRLFALPVCDITGRFRESTARFYRDNPAQVHRLMPWINRDIVCLLRNTEHDVSTLLERINESLLQTNILSPAFRRRLQPFLGAKTSHFIHELNNFARSPYDMIGYDRAVHYLPQAPEEIVIEFSSSASSDEENTSNDNERRTRSRNSRARSDGEFRVLSRSGNSSATGSVGALLSFTVSTTSEGTEAPGVTVSINGRSGQSAAINLSTHNRVSGDIIDLDDSELAYEAGTSRAANDTGSATSVATSTSVTDETATTSATASRPIPTVTDNIELTSSSSDECEFVLERKPPHLRTPELVSLNSESDSDVVFVEESKPLRKSTFISSADEEETVRENANKKSTAQNVTTATEAAAHTSVDHEELYNIGASTSTGLRSSGGGRGVKEMYESSRRSTSSRRKRTLRSSRASNENQAKTSTTVHRGKRIYESSCTSSNSDSTSCTSDSDDEDFRAKRKRSKSRRSSKKRKPNRSRRKVAAQQNNSSANSCGINSTSTKNYRKRGNSSHAKKQQSEDTKRFKMEAKSTGSEYSSDECENLIQLQRRLQARKEREAEKHDQTIDYLIDYVRDNESSVSNTNANNSRHQMLAGSQQLTAMQTGNNLHGIEAILKNENFDSESQNENSVHSDCGLQRLAEAAESLEAAQNVCITSTNARESVAANIAIEEEDNTFSSTVTQTTTATTVTTTPANNRSISRASATTNNTNDNDQENENDHQHDNENEHENCNDDNDNYNSTDTSSTSSYCSDTSMSSPSLYSASSGGGGEEVERGGNNDTEGDVNSLGLQQLLDAASLTDGWLVQQISNAGADNEIEVSTAQHHANDEEANESNDRPELTLQRVDEEAVSLPDIENDVNGIFLNQHDSSLVLPFNYESEGSESDTE
ncbi:E3 ubiquitin-protein ligase Topors [Anastrepha obliqua]|uniref:E3 ubiquitin-protein ligase Topors n=1 Tax=Anastrepha obliqua TaxID=95512 RepID=UPI00240A6649|nr:E3 ubiquitin-protein ligase Topors [Anastrepha obliqua]XP_054738054.1 E3 ubiquitin-protein ligase Topors [Anastrepha obliqua]